MRTDVTGELLTNISVLRRQCPDMRLGQMFVTLEFLAEDMFGKSLYDVEDVDMIAVMQRFQNDLSHREVEVA